MTVSHCVPTVSRTRSDDCVPPPPPLRGADTVGHTPTKIKEPTVSRTQSTRPADLAQELIRLALLARLALELGDPDLARRAARYAVPVVRLLAGLDDGTHLGPLPEVDDLLAQLRPAPIDDPEGPHEPPSVTH
jgi:hypothetical protein